MPFGFYFFGWYRAGLGGIDKMSLSSPIMVDDTIIREEKLAKAEYDKKVLTSIVLDFHKMKNWRKKLLRRHL